MKKTTVGLLIAILGVLVVQPIHAEEFKTLAIIDTAVDSNKIPSVIYEACFTNSLSMACPNKTLSMEGKGAANAVYWPTSITNATYHGYNVTQAALIANKNIKIVFIRIADITTSGNSINTPESLTKAIDWVSKNAIKYSIDAVSISQSSISVSNLASCGTNTIVINAVSFLNSQNIPVFAATGNDGLSDKVGYPSCVSGIIGVGALGSLAKIKTPSTYTEILPSTNKGVGLDVVAQGEINVVRYNGSTALFTATSAATPIAAATYLGNTKYITFNDFMLQLNKVKGYSYVSM